MVNHILIREVSKSEAKQAWEMYQRKHWTQKDVAEAMGWGKTKAAKIIRNYGRRGATIFADN